MKNIINEIWKIKEDSPTRWIFPSTEEGILNQYVDFYHTFRIDEISKGVELLISADTDFVVWLNGAIIGDGQFSNYANSKTYECFDLGDAILKEDNFLAITVFYNGRPSSVYERGEPGLIFEVRSKDCVIASSGTDTLYRQNPCYHNGPIAIVSGQLAYTFGYDARGEDDFGKPDYVPGKEWRNIGENEAKILEARNAIAPRPIPRLIQNGNTSGPLNISGMFRYDITLAESKYESKAGEQGLAGLSMSEGDPVSPAWLMQKAELFPYTNESEDNLALDDLDGGLKISIDDMKGNDGVFLIFDMGREEVGHLELEIDAPEGTIVDAGYGEHLDDGRCRTFLGHRNFAGRYICGEGRNNFKHPYLRWAGRYLQIFVNASEFTLYKLSLRRSEYPVTIRGTVNTGKDLHQRIHDVGCRTLHNCMHEHYEDTPWREQALYANDARTQALCGYYAFGETAMPASSFALLGKGLREDGFINITAPARTGLAIPSFTLVWMLAVRDQYLYSGDDTLARAFLPQITSMLQRYLDETENGLFPIRKQKGLWHFYDWSANMSGYEDKDYEKGLKTDAPFNSLLVMALEAAAEISGWLGGDDIFKSEIDELRSAITENFWNSDEDAFKTHENCNTLAELTQAFAILAKAGDENIRERVLKRMGSSDSGLSGPGLSQSYYTFEALMTDKKSYGKKVLQDIEKVWGKMLDEGATTFWETIKGASDFSNAGSLCHGWSAAPVYVFYHDLLGVRPIEPGFAKFAVEPLTQTILSCSGTVPTPSGDIISEWECKGKDEIICNVNAPDELECVS